MLFYFSLKIRRRTVSTDLRYLLFTVVSTVVITPWQHLAKIPPTLFFGAMFSKQLPCLISYILEELTKKSNYSWSLQKEHRYNTTFPITVLLPLFASKYFVKFTIIKKGLTRFCVLFLLWFWSTFLSWMQNIIRGNPKVRSTTAVKLP